MLKYYILLSFRNLLSHKFQSMFSIVGLAVAFFCFGFFAYFVHGYATWDEYYEKHDRVIELGNSGFYGGTADDQLQELQQRFPEVEAVFRFVDQTRLFEPEDRHFQSLMNVIECDTSLQYIYEPTLMAGDWESAKAGDYSMVLCQSTAIQLYGSVEEAVGQQLYITHYQWGQGTIGLKTNRHETNYLNQVKVYTIRAVVEDLPYNASISRHKTLHAWIFNGRFKELTHIDEILENTNIYISDYYNNRILLREGTDIDDFFQRLEEANIVHRDTHNFDKRLDSRHLDGQHLMAYKIMPFGWGNSLTKWIGLMIILLPGAVILLSALSNFFHLLLSNILMRRREYTLRRAHGAHTIDLWLMVSTQVIVSLLMVGACTLVIVKIGTPWFQVGDFMPNTEVMLGHTCQHIGLLLALGLLIAWMAVIRVRKDSLQESMKTTTGQKPKRHIVRHLLLGWQLMVGYFFLATLAALMMQIRKIDNTYLPHVSDSEKEDIITLPFNVCATGADDDMSLINEWKDALRAIPSIQDFSFDTAPIIGNIVYDRIIINDRPDTVRTNHEFISDRRIEMLHISLLEGQWPQNMNEIVVDKNFVERHQVSIGDRLTPALLQDPLPGMVLGPFIITGIIDNYMEQRFGNFLYRMQNTKDCFYDVMDGDISYGQFTCRSFPGQGNQMRRDLQKLTSGKGVAPEGVTLPLPSLLDEIKRHNDLYQFTPIVNIMAGIALCLALLGIYSSIATDCATRRKEMAIRKINGAKAHHIALHFCRTYGLILAIAMLIDIPILYILLAGFKMGMGPSYDFFDFGPLFWLGTAAIMLLLIALATGWQVWRISRIQPATVVKSE